MHLPAKVCSDDSTSILNRIKATARHRARKVTEEYRGGGLSASFFSRLPGREERMLMKQLTTAVFFRFCVFECV